MHADCNPGHQRIINREWFHQLMDQSLVRCHLPVHFNLLDRFSGDMHSRMVSFKMLMVIKTGLWKHERQLVDLIAFFAVFLPEQFQSNSIAHHLFIDLYVIRMSAFHRWDMFIWVQKFSGSSYVVSAFKGHVMSSSVAWFKTFRYFIQEHSQLLAMPVWLILRRRSSG